MSDQDRPLWPTVDLDQPSVDQVRADQVRVDHVPVDQPRVERSPVSPVMAVPRGRSRHARHRGPDRHGGLVSVAVVLFVAVLGVTTGLATANAVQAVLAVDGTAVPATGPGTPPLQTQTEPPVGPIVRLADHPLLAPGVALPVVDCALPKFRRDLNGLSAYYQALVGCLDAAWHPLLRTGGMTVGSPLVNLAENPGQTGCGNPHDSEDGGDFTALYCPADETLYLPIDRLKEVDGGQASSHLAIVAHEYAHHVQELSGLLWAAAEELDRVGEDTVTGREVSRRIELQANCFAGLFLAATAGRGAITYGLAEHAVSEFRNGGLHDSHGSKAHQAEWASRGYRTATTASCNTWIAPSADVS